MTPDPYAARWKTIDSLDQQGLYRSALEASQALLTDLRQRSLPDQIVKALIYRAKFTRELNENGTAEAIDQLEAEIATAGFPAKPLLQSFLAEVYQNYLSQNQWQINRRTALSTIPGDDIASWTVADFIDQINTLYLASLENKQSQQWPLASLQAVVDLGQNTISLRPTLYDFLAFRAIDYFSTAQSGITTASYQFILDQTEAFAPAATFAAFAFTTSDPSASLYQALQVYQQLLSFRLADSENMAARIDADLHRLAFAHQHSTLDNKDELYHAALEQLRNQYAGTPSVHLILFAEARYFFERGQKYQAETSADLQFDWRYAHGILREIESRFASTLSAQKAKALRGIIENKELSVTNEAVYLPDAPGLFQVNYRNLNRVFWRIVKLDRDEVLKWDESEKMKKKLLSRAILRSAEQALPRPGDYRSHRTEMMFENLPLGFYAILLSDNADFSEANGHFAFQHFAVSRLGAIVSNATRGGSAQLKVADRETGAPLPGVEVLVYGNQYPNRGNNIIGRSQTNSSGRAELDLQNNRSGRIFLRFGGDQLFTGDHVYTNRSRGEQNTRRETTFFLDRGIYRPGQTLYFKALLLEYSAEFMPSLLKNEPVNIVLRDINGEEVSSLDLRSNEYGSVQGTFLLPQGKLGGQMSMVASIGGTYQAVRVEEYKRPRFLVEVSDLNGRPKLGDEVVMEGTAEAYAGPALQDAKVRYTVTRSSLMPWWMSRYYPGGGQSEQVASGETTTDDTGKFRLSFVATPPRNMATMRWRPNYQYQVQVDVTDVTGETHSAEKNIFLTQTGIQLDITAPALLDRSDDLSVVIKAYNADRKSISFMGNFEAVRLGHPEQVFVERYWEKPDQPIISRTQFKAAFPHLAYANEDEMTEWPSLGMQYRKQLSGPGDSLTLSVQDWPTGVYLLKITTNDGESSQVYLKLYDQSADIAPVGEIFWVSPIAERVAPGEKARFKMATSTGSLITDVQVFNRTEQKDQRWVSANPWATYELDVTEADRGGLRGTANAIRYNRFFQKTLAIAVPWSNKQLTIAYETFRDKLRPGQEEEWRIKISGPQGDAIAAELTAAMYDESLDQLYPFSWQFSPYPSAHQMAYWQAASFRGVSAYGRSSMQNPPIDIRFDYPSLRTFNWWRYGGPGVAYMVRSRAMADGAVVEEMALTAIPQSAAPPPPPPAPVANKVMDSDAAETDQMADAEETTMNIPIRKNLSETAFFFPQIKTDRSGGVVLSFKTPEALTRWKVQLFAHDTDLAYTLDSRSVVTQKELMIVPNAPRFLREGDQIAFTAKVSNLSGKFLSGRAKLELFDAADMTSLAEVYALQDQEQTFALETDASQGFSWKIEVPENAAGGLVYRVTAQSGNFSDGEEAALPVLSNRTMLTAALPLHLNAKQTETFTLDPLANLPVGAEAKSLSLEITSNPAWLAVKALPYLMEYPYNCTEQLVNRFYANSLATEVANRHPRIKRVFDDWRNSATALESPLTVNQELAGILLEETPWVRDAASEAEQQQRIATLFDMNRMAAEKEAALTDLLNRQQSDGSFAWFPGGQANWYMTQYVMESLYRLSDLGVVQLQARSGLQQLMQKAGAYLDTQVKEQYEKLRKEVEKGNAKWEDDHLSALLIHYLYVSSFRQTANADMAAVRLYYLDQADQHWLTKSLHDQGMLALALHQSGRAASAKNVYRSLEERALRSDELGMYWKYPRGFYWNELPIETHTLMIELFTKMDANQEDIDALKVWLLKNKQTNRWETTKATAAAVYALLQDGQEWLGESQLVQVTFPQANREAYADRLARAESSAEAGTGYYRTQWTGADISPDLATLRLKNKNKTIAWGGLYLQFVQDIDQVQRFADTPLDINRQIFVRTNDERGQRLQEIQSREDLSPGQRITVRLTISTDREMEFVHLKDLRASGLEPTEVLSGYRYQDALSYYQSTTDIGTHFFFDYLPKGTYVLEYDLFVIYKGDFSNGIASLQCMYAPSFSAYSEGSRLQVGEQ